MDSIVEFRNVHIEYPLKKYTIKAVSDLSLRLRRGKITALVGESGSGKTTLASSLINCISPPGRVAQGEIVFFGGDNAAPAERHIETMRDKDIRAFRWNRVSMVFQSAQSALNPIMTVREQFFETLREHGRSREKQEMEKRCRELLTQVKLDADRALCAYPHELSGGMKQRVMIAFALLLDPDLIILDEPTTALDVITQDYVFSLLKEINQRLGVSMMLMTHDISVVARFADYMGVMYGGRLMEYGAVGDVFRRRRHPYTRGLIGATPSIIGDGKDMSPIQGNPVDLLQPPAGCVFSPRCADCKEICGTVDPETTVFKDGSTSKCHFSGVNANAGS